MSHPLTKMHRHIESSISHLIHTFPNWPPDDQTLVPPDNKDKSHFPTWIRWRPVQSLRRRRRQNRRRNDGNSDFTPNNKYKDESWGYDTVDEDTEVSNEEGRIEVIVSVVVYVRAVMLVFCCETSLLSKLFEWIADNVRVPLYV